MPHTQHGCPNTIHADPAEKQITNSCESATSTAQRTRTQTPPTPTPHHPATHPPTCSRACVHPPTHPPKQRTTRPPTFSRSCT